ncbi:MAG: exodeoxyribonuclease VII small subunit [Planctomycetota bacterium]
MGEKAENELGFEAAFENLEAIVERIESGEIGLEASIAEYEKGVALVKRCRAILEKAEQKIETLERERGDEGS